jgi:hypothetical protein
MFNCIYCNKKFSNKGGRGAHSPYCKENPNRISRPRSPLAGRKKGSKPWNYGLKGVQVGWNKGLVGVSGGKASTPEKELARVQKISVAMKKYGGYRQGSGRGKKGWYKGFFCDSSWELAYVIYCLDKRIPIQRNTEKLIYEYDGQIKTYIPDFVVDGRITEIKGFKSPQWEAKLKSNPHVAVLYEDDMKPILEYVTLTYGKDYIRLYEK